MKSVRFQTLGTNKKVIIVHPHTRYWSPVERTLKLFLNFFLQEKIQTQETGRPFVPVPFFVFLRGRFCKFFWFNRTSKIGAVEGVISRKLKFSNMNTKAGVFDFMFENLGFTE
jgi:hypothetical protein